MASQGSGPEVTQLGQKNFKLVFFGVLGVVVLSIVLYTILAVSYNEPPTHVRNLLTLFDFLIKAGFGAIIGLFGGKYT